MIAKSTFCMRLMETGSRKPRQLEMEREGRTSSYSYKGFTISYPYGCRNNEKPRYRGNDSLEK